MRCAVYGCNNNNGKNSATKWRFFHFPKDKAAVKQWINFCRRTDKINVKNACICEVHFAPEAFERNLQFEMGLSSRNPTKLLPNAFPTLTTAPAEANERQKRMESRSKKEMLAAILKNTAPVEVIQEDEVGEAPQTAEEEVIDEKDEKILHLETEIQRLNSVVSTLNKCKNEQLEEIKRLKISIKTAEFHRNNLEQKLSSIFTNGQIEKLRDGNKRRNWKEEDIAMSITLYSTSPKAYKLLRRNNFPLPGVRTLQWWSKKIGIAPGVKINNVKIEN
ncbi:52 kDa repressor of the inhibitor of the protein kinase [Bactrocera neohumeralis]|uniref:52 kDa repressor of the inhibitor of the protein kinase n=1 Tax=Bactrocera neohumeralis TaxID=98809 RepID=UPI00216518CB|nr:52 kDa repressor of the inhibitor of the protein kinase [Bactrocera neohumeralis]XP_050336475.1 52 kDa repressor of the inhibitor of the protein kinase [Bactrocera neohumeralis]XP_050336476.1 52 kDa repressor of the inhibitor of the protein kinase [Bactrocera neohumeralis]